MPVVFSLQFESTEIESGLLCVRLWRYCVHCARSYKEEKKTKQQKHNGCLPTFQDKERDRENKNGKMEKLREKKRKKKRQRVR